MAVDYLDRLIVESADIRGMFGEIDFSALDTFEEKVTGVWIPYKPSGATNSEALAIASWNWAPGAVNAAEDGQFPYDQPTAHDSFLECHANTPCLTRIPHSTNMAFYTWAKSDDTVLGTTGSDRCPLIGTYGNALNKGAMLALWSRSQVRGITYENTGTPAIVNCPVDLPTNSANLWRIYRLLVSNTEIKVKNCSLDSVTDEDTQSITSGHVPGLQNLTLYGRISSGGTNYNELPFFQGPTMAFNDVPDAGQETTILAQMRVLASMTGGDITELAT